MEEPTVSDPQQDPVRAMLDQFVVKAMEGKFASLAIAYVQKDGAAAVQSTPMAAVTMNHLLMLFHRKVARVYDRALAASEQARSPTGAIRPQSPQSPAAQLPRKVRRQVEAQQKKLQKKAAKKAKGKLNGPPLPVESGS